MNVIEEWVEHVFSTDFKNFNLEDVVWAKRRVLDVIGCMAAGAKAPGNEDLIDLLSSWGSGKDVSVFFYSRKLPLIHAAAANSIIARSLDYGPVDPEFEEQFFPGHISETTIPTALSIAEYLGNCTGKDLLTSLILAEDIACRLLAASNYNPQTHGWNNISVVNSFSVVTLYARLLRLDGKKLRNAYGLLLDLICGTFQNTQDRTTAFKLCQGLAAKNGIMAVELANIGWTGARDPLFSRYGYFKMFTPGLVSSEPLTKDLGKKFFTDRTIKPYPCCRLTHAAIDCAILLHSELQFCLNDIQEVVLLISHTDTASSIAERYCIGEFPQANAIFNYQYPIATALIKGTFKPSDHEMSALNRPDVIQLARKIRVVPSMEITFLHESCLKIKFKNGQEVSKRVHVAKGDRRKNPLSDDEIKAKFFENMAYGGKIDKAEKILELVNTLEDLENVRFLTDLLK